MIAQELLSELVRKGVNLEVVGNELRIDAPKGVLTAELRQSLIEHKQAILTLLSPPPIGTAAPTIQEPDSREKELDELLLKLKQVNRHWKIEWARKKNVSLKALLHATNLWLSDDPDDWTAANDTIFAFTSHWGRKQLCYRRAEKVAIPEIASGKRG